MQLTILKNELFKGIEAVNKALKGSKNDPIYKSIKIDAKKEGILLTGTNEEFTIMRMIPLEFKGSELATLQEEGTALLNGKTLIEAIKNMPKDDIKITTEKNQVIFKSGKFQCKLNSQVLESYPKLPTVDTSNQVPLSQPLFKKYLDQTLYACSTKETRPVLKGLRFSIDKGEVSLMATDSYAMSFIKDQLDVKTSTIPDIVIPSTPLEEMKDLLSSEKTSECTFSWSDKHLLINVKHNLTLVYIRLLKDKYPVDRTMIPNEHTLEIKTKRKLLLTTLKRVSAFGSDLVEMRMKDNKIFFHAIKDQEGTLSDELSEATIEGAEQSIAFNPKKVIKALEQQKYNNEDILIKLNGELKPFRITFGSEDNIQLFSPIRIKN